MSGSPGHVTLHLVPASAWAAWRADPDPAARYAPPAFAAEGFVHCTDGDEAMLAIANRFHGEDPETFLVLDVDLGQLDVPWRYDEPGSPYPHVYGPLRRDAVTAVRAALRDARGRFVGYGERSGP